MSIPIDGFTVATRALGGRTYDIYRRGAGPGVVVMPEIPGITPPVARFARTVADAGFTVLLPSLFGTPNKPMTPLYAMGQAMRACIRREFRVFAANDASPVIDFLRALCRELHEELGGRGVGAVGMCLTGNFALALMVDPSMMAPVLSQPSLPAGPGRSQKRGLHLAPSDLASVKQRRDARLLAMRFTNDPLCPKERFERLREEFGERVETIEIDSSPGNPHRIPPRAHSVVTADLVDEAGHPTRIALDRVLAFLRERLMETAS